MQTIDSSILALAEASNLLRTLQNDLTQERQRTEYLSSERERLENQYKDLRQQLELITKDRDTIRQDKAALATQLQELKDKHAKRSPKATKPVDDDRGAAAAAANEPQSNAKIDLKAAIEAMGKTECTASQYVKVFNKILKNIGIKQPTDDEVVEYLEGTYPNHNTLQNHLSAYTTCILALGRTPSDKLLDRTGTAISSSFSKREYEKGERQVDVDEVNATLSKKVEEWKIKSQRSKQPDPRARLKRFATEDTHYLMARLVHAMQVNGTPLRSQDYYNSAVTELESDKCPDGFSNWLCLETGELHLDDRKSCPTVVDVPNEFLEAVREFRTKYSGIDIKLLLPNTNNGAYESDGIVRLMKAVFGPGIGITFLRNCKSSEEEDKGISAEELKKRAKASGHSVRTRKTCYTKFSKRLHPADESDDE